VLAFLLALFLLVCGLIVAIILVQAGQEAGFAGAFGAGGGSQTVFGARAGTFLTRATAGLVAVFMILAFLLVLFGAHRGSAPPKVPTPEGVPADTATELPIGTAAEPAGAGQPATADTGAPQPQPSGGE